MRIDKTYRPELLASKDRERSNITDPYLDAAEGRVVATNGHALVALPVETDKTERSRYLATHLLKAARMLGDEEVQAEIDDAEIKPFGVFWPAEQMGRTFPPWRDIVPTFRRGDEGTVSLSLNAMQLKRIADAMGVVTVTLTVRPSEPEGPVLVQPVDPDAEEVGVLMPVVLIAAHADGLKPGQFCPVCRRLLAAGCPCPEHGDPLAKTRAALEAQADAILQNSGDGELVAKDLK